MATSSIDIGSPSKARSTRKTRLSSTPCPRKLITFKMNIFEDYISKNSRLAQGSWGQVYKAQIKGRSEPVVALKVCDNKGCLHPSSKWQKMGESEKNLLSSIKSDHIIELIGYASDHRLALVYEYMEFNLKDRKNKMTYEEKIEALDQIAQGINYLHNLADPIIHWDLKPDNILLNPKIVTTANGAPMQGYIIMIGDFGLATRKSEQFGFVGSVEGGYVLKSDKDSAKEKADIHAFGMIIQDLIGSKHKKGTRFVGGSEREKLIQKLINKCTEYSPVNRPSIDDVIAKLNVIKHIPLEATSTNSTPP